MKLSLSKCSIKINYIDWCNIFEVEKIITDPYIDLQFLILLNNFDLLTII